MGDRGHEVVASTESRQLGGDVPRDDDGTDVAAVRVGEAPRRDGERPARTGLRAEPHDLVVEDLATASTLQRQLVGR